MTHTVTLEEVLAAVWARHTAGGAPEWMHGLGASDTRRRLGRAVAARWLGLAAHTESGGGRVRSTVRLDPEEAVALQRWLGGPGWDVVRDLSRTARTMKDETVATLRAGGVTVTPRDVGSWALGVVGAFHWRHGRYPTVADLAETADRYQASSHREGPLRTLRLERPAFDAVADPEWDRVWPKDRAAAPPSAVGLGLGRAERPPMYGRTGDWQAGTDRPVHLRYRRYFDNRSRIAAPGVAPERHITRRYLGGDPSVIVVEELRRAAAPLGLAVTGHVAGVTAVANALRPNPRRALVRDVDGVGLLAAWSEAADPLPVGPDPDLTRAVAAFAVEWTANTDLAEVLELDAASLGRAVARRVWHRLHGREVEWDTPVDRAGLVRELRGAFQRHLLEYDEPPDGPPQPAVSSAADRSPDEPPAAAADLTEAQQRTFGVLGLDPRTPRMTAMMLDGDEAGWRQLYSEIVAGLDGALSADAVFDFMHDLPEAS
ncbi:hypothetical protein [Pseudonocardia sp. ICBG1034]|uniref:hypothetical protein n=1 Tax=Pseudonocardia sp. ICBG1034 TaxID=2844381 RepID=UPI001CD02031|nr:hypothetical protein [Pseudonocardia sp. ICBG1034]